MGRTVPAEAEALLTSEPLVAHLATSHDDRPHSAPLWYDYRDGEIEIATTGRKLQDIRENPRVSLSVQRTEDDEPQWGLTVHGIASVVEEEAESQAILRRINQRYGADADAWSENTAVRIDVGSVRYWEY